MFATVIFSAAAPARAGNIFLTGHDIDEHGGQAGYDNVVLDYLRAAGTSNEFPKASYKIAVLGSGVGFWKWSDAGVGVVQKPGYGTTTFYNTATLTNAAAWASVLANDCLMITSHTSCGGCDLSTAGIATINANAAQIRAAFDAGMDIWANSGANGANYYGFLPPNFAVSGPALAGSPGSPFVPTAFGASIGITGAMIFGFATHNTFTNVSSSLVTLETFESPGHPQDHAVISLGARNLRFTNPCPMPVRAGSNAGTLDAFAGAETTTIPLPERAAFATFIGSSRSFDQAGVNAPFGHSFVGLPDGIISARLLLRMRPEAGSTEGNDTIALQFDDNTSTFAWTRELGNSGAVLGVHNYAWLTTTTTPPLVPAGDTFELDLAALTQQSGPTINLLPSLNTVHHLDVYVEDDTNVDWMQLLMVTCPCVTPPKNMVAWYQFDQPAVASPDEPDAAGGSLAKRIGTTRVLGSFVGDCLSFNAANPDLVQVKNGAENNFGAASFSIDAWVRMTSVNGIRTIVDKRAGASPTTIGYRFYALNGYLGCTLADSALPGQTEYQSTDNAAAAKLANGAWHHVTMTVERVKTPKLVTLYQDGAVIAQFSALGKTGSVTNSNSVLIGHGFDYSGSPNAYSGSIDEVEFFNRALQPSEVLALYAAGRNGKCKQGCYLSYPSLSVLGFAGKAQDLVCNFSSSAQTFNWAVTGLATGPGCNVSGALLGFTPASGSVVVPPFKCVSVQFSVNTTALLCTDRACFEVTLTNTGTGEITSCTGSAYPLCAIDITALLPFVVVSGKPEIATPAVFDVGITNVAVASGSLPYELQVVDSRTGLPSDVVSLNGLPVGTPSSGALSLAPGMSGTIPVSVQFVDYDAFVVHELQIKMDLDGDGVLEVVGVMPLLSSPAPDCDVDGASDQEELLAGAADCDDNGVPDACEPDCNGNNISDVCDITSATSLDANGNGIPDECELVGVPVVFCTNGSLGVDHTTACPCGNTGAPGNGCGHSFDPNGANMEATGSAGNDDIVLHASGEPTSSFTLMMQHANAGDVLFVDGVLCASNPLIRLRGRAAVGGEAFFPNSNFAQDSTTTLSQRGGVTVGSGSVRYYAGWYRNASVTFCPPSTANVTNGLIVTW